MKAKVSVIGVVDSTALIKKIAPEFQAEAEFDFYIYNELQDIDNYLAENKDYFDIFIFTGSYPLRYVENNIELNKPYMSIIKSSVTVVETFWKIRDAGIDYKKISIDRSPRKEIIETLESLNIPTADIYIMPDSSQNSLAEIYQKHLKLYQNGKTEAMIVSNRVVYEKLKEKNLPAFRILPSRFLVRQSLRKAIALVNTEKIKDTQAALQIIKIENINNNISLDYKSLKCINNFDDILIDYTQDNHGSFFKFGSTEYLIFTTKAFLKKDAIEKKFGLLVEKTEDLNITFSSGVGYGETIYKAEYNARLALSYALKEEGNNCFIVESDSSIIGPIYGENSYNLAYKLVNTDKKTREIYEETGVSEKYISKLQAIIKQLNKNIFDSKELANYLKISQRSASRIINKLEAGGAAKNIGKKNEKKKGRPKNIYKLIF